MNIVPLMSGFVVLMLCMREGTGFVSLQISISKLFLFYLLSGKNIVFLFRKVEQWNPVPYRIV